jgi:hypothetical protein
MSQTAAGVVQWQNGSFPINRAQKKPPEGGSQFRALVIADPRGHQCWL